MNTHGFSWTPDEWLLNFLHFKFSCRLPSHQRTHCIVESVLCNAKWGWSKGWGERSCEGISLVGKKKKGILKEIRCHISIENSVDDKSSVKSFSFDRSAATNKLSNHRIAIPWFYKESNHPRDALFITLLTCNYSALLYLLLSLV